MATESTDVLCCRQLDMGETHDLSMSTESPTAAKPAEGSSSDSTHIASSLRTHSSMDLSPDIFHRSCIHNPLRDCNSSASRSFTVVSYNILAECHKKLGDYHLYTEEKFLTQEFRHQLLLQELLYLDADVICLQEVNPSYYNKHLHPALLKHGYQGVFIKRTQDFFDEGEATFFRTKRFSLECHKGIPLTADLITKVEGAEQDTFLWDAVKKYLDRSDVISVCTLRCSNTDKKLTVGNVHVTWDDLRCQDVQALQIASAVKHVVLQAGGDAFPHIICGDFNSFPTSVGYQLMCDGSLLDTNKAFLTSVKNIKSSTGPKSLINYLLEEFKHTSSNIASAYKTCLGHEPEITCRDYCFTGCLDYIFYGRVGLGVADILGIVDSSVIDKNGGLPNKGFPSDHVSLKSTLYFK
ncbi:2',5'-phosphodiesterase 12-like [Haliotis rufescens]|uniref:2',5'-phosphodiesterase 12-like n=1 Tax=Haliotis rufescens TaxID=6454 RepID=UPI00201EEF51|nr:2',5'-phosphodiesterase 12-like [Haliotis rufescens]XP_046330033.2 2',5'-phosphodiesterase 12-like [Haliotis rufescens]XP_046330034.2 2',5'-phosphodiesterase 12-like [Haliotis rufescens]XP_046330035.2 2',5'-phosphodiesterase 12-like [Haliotis rufescens]XP_048239564.1 2',5'-phosphodiesterase 12-like [Haliotis rufescens]